MLQCWDPASSAWQGSLVWKWDTKPSSTCGAVFLSSTCLPSEPHLSEPSPRTVSRGRGAGSTQGN